jgi:aspartyl-tRNA synthetase
VGTITSLENPVVDATRFRLNGSPAENAKFIREFMDNLPKSTLDLNPASIPGVFVYDESKPLNGLAPLGHEGADRVANITSEGWEKLEHGDILIVHARENTPFRGEAWTDLGRLRKAIYDSAVGKGLLDRDLGFNFMWVIDFPLFTPDDQQAAAGEGQRGLAGIKATHHPFTAPREPVDLRDAKDPLKITADHYDLVLNGVEIGGGSVRIHDAATQEYVFKEMLKMPPEAMGHFDHLLGALRAGCPPHAGFALGWDRFLTMLFDVDSVRDVIPFPKNQKGEDLMARSPSTITPEQMATYHLAPKRS